MNLGLGGMALWWIYGDRRLIEMILFLNLLFFYKDSIWIIIGHPLIYSNSFIIINA